VFGQFVGKDNLSISLFYMQKSELDSAQLYIDKAVTDDDLKTAAKTWYYKGFIYKELYKKKEKDDKTSSYRLTAISSFEEMLRLEGKEEFKESSAKILKYLASTLYNDAARLLDPTNYPTAISNYDLFRSTMLLSNPATDLKSRDVKFKLALASMLNRPAETAAGLDSTTAYQIKDLYKEILEAEPDNPAANYNLAILYYNEAADIINNMDYDMDIMKLNEVQDYCIEIFLKALPPMKKSYELGYKRKETLIGLSNIYYGLNDMNKSDFFKNELKILETEESIKKIEKKIKTLEEKGENSTDEYKTLQSQLDAHNNELQSLQTKRVDLEKE
jgi:hypothetical protein